MKPLVTGGGGFLGLAVVKALLEEGRSPTAASRHRHPELEQLGVTQVEMDLGDPQQVRRALAGHDTVFHVAALTGVWGRSADFHRTNVLGTRHVLAACREEGVGRLIYTSSPSVCFDGKDHRRAGNDLPYAERFLAAYPRSKAQAEREVLAASGPELATCALRPHLIVGPGDPHILPRILERGRAGRLAVIGRGDNEVSLTWVHNAARAHLDAARSLAPGAPHAGRAYFIAQSEPVRLWPFIDQLLEAAGLPPVRRRVSRGVASAAGGLCELLWKSLPLRGEPPMTRFVAAELATSHSYDLKPAARDFGYRELVSTGEATERLLSEIRSDRRRPVERSRPG